MREQIKKHLRESIEIKSKMLSDENFIDNILEVVTVLSAAYKKGNKVLIAGNGGSAADAQHIACELVSKLYSERPALFALALNTNSSILTAVANDFSYDKVFSRQIEALGLGGDILLAISTSGNSKNIVKAVEQARKEGLITIGLTGGAVSKIDNLCDYIIKVPSTDTPLIQEGHIMVAHILCELVEKEIEKDLI